MTHEWKPGDVAMVEGKVALRVHGPHQKKGQEPLWQWGRGDWTTLPLGPIRPLVVIDPEDHEQVERLDKAYQAALDTKYAGLGDVMQAALRSLIAPPKLPEPTGLGAVVEDAEGHRWTRVGADKTPWYRVDSHDWYRWQNVAAVKVLSEGVTR